MINGYGPTENTVSSTEFVVDKEYKTIPIGKSQLNVRSYIVDENLKRVPVGASGELCVAGRQVARGYAGAQCHSGERNRFGGTPAGYILKPADQDKVLETIQEVLRK